MESKENIKITNYKGVRKYRAKCSYVIDDNGRVSRCCSAAVANSQVNVCVEFEIQQQSLPQLAKHFVEVSKSFWQSMDQLLSVIQLNCSGNVTDKASKRQQPPPPVADKQQQPCDGDQNAGEDEEMMMVHQFMTEMTIDDNISGGTVAANNHIIARKCSIEEPARQTPKKPSAAAKSRILTRAQARMLRHNYQTNDANNFVTPKRTVGVTIPVQQKIGLDKQQQMMLQGSCDRRQAVNQMMASRARQILTRSVEKEKQAEKNRQMMLNAKVRELKERRERIKAFHEKRQNEQQQPKSGGGISTCATRLQRVKQQVPVSVPRKVGLSGKNLNGTAKRKAPPEPAPPEAPPPLFLDEKENIDDMSISPILAAEEVARQIPGINSTFGVKGEAAGGGRSPLTALNFQSTKAQNRTVVKLQLEPVESYELTPPPTKFGSDCNNYDISSMVNSDQEDDGEEEKRRCRRNLKPIPSWARREQLMSAVRKQFSLPPEELNRIAAKIFPRPQLPVDLAAIGLNVLPEYKKRSSSAIWTETPNSSQTNLGDQTPSAI